MSYTIKGFRGKDGPILLDFSGLANVPGAIQSIGALTARPGDHFEVAAVDDDGKITAVKAVEKPGGGAGQNCDCPLTVEIVTVGEDSGGDEDSPVAVTGLSLDLTSYNAKVGGGFYINPVVLPANATNRSVSWQSSKPSVATVNNMGYVECIAEGDAVITCTTVDGGFTATCAVSVAAESGGGDGSGGGDAGATVYFKDSPYTLTEGELMKPNGTTGAVSSAGYLAIPYTDGITIATCMNASWSTNTYPRFVVLDGGTYTPILGEETGKTLKTGVNQYAATFTGYGEGAVIYANLAERTYMQSNKNGPTDVDTTTFYYYTVPGGDT